MSIQGRQTMDHEKVSFNLAKMKKAGHNFEIAVDPDLAIDFKKGKNVEIGDVLKGEHIFHDVKKGELAQEKEIIEVFGTTDVPKVAEMIIQQGEIQLTAEHRQKITEEKRRKIISIIQRNGLDPKTKLPHPPQRIELAFEEIKVRIDEFRSAEEQVDEILKKLRPVLPISFETKRIAIKIPAQHTGKAYSIISQFSKPLQEEWLNDGAYSCVVEIPAGLEPDLYEKINSFTHGDAETKIVEK